MSRSLRVLAIVGILVVLPIQPAKACSCALGDPRDMFADADGAFVGTFVESHPVDPNPSSSGADTIYTFVLDEEHKGELGEPGGTVEVHAPLSGASCGLEATPGEQYGIFLDTRARDGAWTSSLCQQVSPETMREAASPLPAPTSDGPVRMVAGGSFGDMQTMFLDGRGRTVAYGSGDRDVVQVEGCKGAARVVEVARSYPARPVLVVRDLETFDSVRSVELPVRRGLSVDGVRCLSESGARAAVFATDYGQPARSVLLRVEGDEVEVLHEGTGRSATFAGGAVYVQQGKWGRRLTRVSLRTGRERSVVRLPGLYSSELAVSPDGRRLAGVAYPPYEDVDERPSRVYIVDLDGPAVRTHSLGTGDRWAQVLWQTDTRVAMFVSYPDASRVFDLRFEVHGRFGRWEPSATTILGDTAYGVDYRGRLIEVDLPGGTPRGARRLPSPVVYDLSKVR